MDQLDLHASLQMPLPKNDHQTALQLHTHQDQLYPVDKYQQFHKGMANNAQRFMTLTGRSA